MRVVLLHDAMGFRAGQTVLMGDDAKAQILIAQGNAKEAPSPMDIEGAAHSLMQRVADLEARMKILEAKT